MKKKVTILLVEDDANLRSVVTYHLEKSGYEVIGAANGKEALDVLETKTHDLILTDVRMPVMDGLKLLATLREREIETPVVVMTAYGSITDAVEAVKNGASDYLTKPVKKESLLLAVKKALKVDALTRENRRLKEQLEQKNPLQAILGTSNAIQEVVKAIERVGRTEATVLITGESGTGKELAARALHYVSTRNNKPFVAINCAALPAELMESELFGHERGAFTGAVQAKPGKFQQANGGTLFLDEIGDMAPALQAKILRALQERVVDPVGSRASVPVDVRLLTATHRNLKKKVEEGEFREDLYWRLNVIPIHMPPLRDRPEDVELLLMDFYRKYGGGEFEIEDAALKVLVSYEWPGNVRQVQNLCQRLAVLFPDQRIALDMLPSEIRGGKKTSPVQESLGENGLWELERRAIMDALEENRGNRSAAARELKIPRHVLLYRLKKFGIDK